MFGRGLVRYALPPEERDPRFREELGRLSVIGLRVIAGVTMGAPLFILSIGLLLPRLFDQVQVTLLMVLLGAAALGLSFWPPARPHARSVGLGVGYLVAALQLGSVMSFVPSFLAAAFAFEANLAVVLMVGIAALPLRPVQTLALGLAITATFLVAGPTHPGWHHPETWIPVVGLVTVVFIGAVLTALVYRQRFSLYQARCAAEKSVSELQRAQARLLISETAASQGRFAAALSHELNSPLGALRSAVDTLLLVFRHLAERPEASERLKEVASASAEAARRSSERLKEIVGRMKAIANLDRAEAQVVDLNGLFRETVAFLRHELEPRAHVKLSLKPLPPVRCRPQQMSAVFSHLLRNAIAAMESRGHIEIVSDRRGQDIVLEVRDDGRGIAADRLTHLFEPAIRVEGSRVHTSNWGLFLSRAIVNDHGGQIEIASAEGRGTTARIVLPLAPNPPVSMPG